MLALVLVTLLALGAASCSSGSDGLTSAPEGQTDSGQTGSADSSGGGGRIQIDNFIFSAVVPGPFTFKPGETITVENLDGTEHTLTSADGLFDTGVINAEDGTATFVAPSEPGTYEFFCSIHPEMIGTMIISG
jgi:plastocyanin